MSCRMACHILVEHLLHGTFWYINWNFGISMAHLWGVPCADGGLHHVQKERSSEATTWLSHDVRRLHRLPGLPFFKPWSKGHPVGILWRTFDILTFEPCNPTMTHFISYLCDDLMECLSLLILDAKFFTLYILWNLLLLKWSLGRSNDISNDKNDLHDFCQARFCVKCHGAWFEDHSCLVFKRREELFKDLEWFYRKLLAQIIRKL